MTTYRCIITYEEDLLGTAPTNKKIYQEFILGKAADLEAAAAAEELETVPVKTAAEELDALPLDTVTNGVTGFHRDNLGQNILYNYHLRGFFTEACSHRQRQEGTLSKALKAYKKVIRGQVHVWPRRIPIILSRKPGMLERPVRAQTPQGERVALTSSYTAPALSRIEFDIEVLDDKTVPEAMLREWLDFGRYIGMGQWRSSGLYGTFTYTLDRKA